jgi:hypothetical protein
MSTTKDHVPLDLWNAIPLAPVRFRRLAAGVAVAVLAPFGAWAVQRLGVIRPNIDVVATEGHFDEVAKAGSVRFHIRNSGRLAITVERVSSDRLDLRPGIPVRIAPGTTGELEEAFTGLLPTCSGREVNVVHYQAWSGRHAISMPSTGIDLCRLATTSNGSGTQ